MANLIYAAIASLDGYVADEEGKFDWARPDDEVHAFINGLERSAGTFGGGMVHPALPGPLHRVAVIAGPGE